ncbi:MAG: Na-K-Cl cotransporter, partial [Gemmatimonadetes bacterium]|nr:Na-K-Cl cotransporter [Gemmatimonadota bacterium]
GAQERIDIWWGGLQRNGGLMILLAYLIRTADGWRRATVNVNLVAQSEAAAQGARSNLVHVLEHMRIRAEVNVFVADDRPFAAVLRETSMDADLIFMGIAEPDDDFVSYFQHMQDMIVGLPPVALVLAAQDIDFADVLL